MTASKKSALVSTFVAVFSLVALARPVLRSPIALPVTSPLPAIPTASGVTAGPTVSHRLSIGIPSAQTIISGTVSVLWLSTTNNDGRLPYALFNGTTNTIINGFSPYQPGQLGVEGGDSNTVGVVRWTAPFSGTFSINTTFSGMDTVVGDSSDVHILHNGVAIFNSTVIGTPAPTTYSGLQSITAGDSIDFVVGNGGNGAYDDNTLLLASIVSVPGPCSRSASLEWDSLACFPPVS